MNKQESFKIILDQLKDNNISEYIFLNQSDISYSHRLRDYCELFCPNFNKSWRCPPNVGSIDQNIARCKQYKYGLLLSAYLELDDETIEKSDEDIYVICRRKLNPVFHKIGKQIEKFVGQQVLILRSFCTLCKTCTFPDSPCLFPEISGSSVESHGIQMVSMMEKFQFSRFSNNRGYTCIALILFDCDFIDNVYFGKKVILKGYPPFIEGQHYVNLLYESGECCSAIDLKDCKPYKSGIYPLNGAISSSVCLLCCDSLVTVSLVVNELSKSKIPVQLLVMDTHRHSVLHAYSEGIFVTDTITHFIHNLESEIASRKLIIPRGIFMLKESLHRALPKWEIRVAPDKMADLPQYLEKITKYNI